MNKGGGTGEAGEATASLKFRGFTTEKFLASWIYERGNFSCFTGKKLIPTPLVILPDLNFLVHKIKEREFQKKNMSLFTLYSCLQLHKPGFNL